MECEHENVVCNGHEHVCADCGVPTETCPEAGTWPEETSTEEEATA